MMTDDSLRLAGIVLVLFPTVIYGGVSRLGFLLAPTSGYTDDPLRQDLFRAGHAHAGVLLILSLVMLRYVDEAWLSVGWKSFVRLSAPIYWLLGGIENSGNCASATTCIMIR